MNQPHCYTIAAGQDFLSILAQWLMKRYGDPLVLSSCLILLPSRRACRGLREAFLRENDGKPMLLPRIQPLADMDAPELMYDEATAEATSKLPPVVHANTRQLLLTQLVSRFVDIPIHQAFPLASELARLLDEIAREECDIAKLENLAPENYAKHWQQIVGFLSIISKHWPRILAERGEIDPKEHQVKLLSMLAEHWEKSPPDSPVIAAGSTGSVPATARLLKVIAHMPSGAVILPGLERDMALHSWNMLSPTHPQYGLKQLLAQMNIVRDAVVPIGEDWACPLWSAAFAPAEATAQWPHLPATMLETLAHTQIIVADTKLEEARMIGIKLREILEIPAKTAAVITPDRALAKMIAAQMQRYGVALDDSAGMALKDTPPAVLMRLILDVIATNAAPHTLLALLRHPFAAAGIEPFLAREYSRIIELKLLRGPRITRGIAGLMKAFEHVSLPLEIGAWLKDLCAILLPLSALHAGKATALNDLLSTHILAAEQLATTPSIAGNEILWRNDDGNQLAESLAEWKRASVALPLVDSVFYPALFEQMLSGETFRPRYGQHPRLHILSPLEARLLSFDCVILAGLNEGVWPQSNPADPWMSRPMRSNFGLPPHERQVGQSAHDVWMFSHASELWLTRARKSEGAPTIASRWWVRLQTLTQGLDAARWQAMDVNESYRAKLMLLDAPLLLAEFKRPAASPPGAARPRKLYVTHVDTWLANPYEFYAKHILKLRPLNPLDQEPDSRDFGQIIHRIFERFCSRYPQHLPEDASAQLRTEAQSVFADYLDRPTVAALWWPRFEAISRYWLNNEIPRRQHTKEIISEKEASATWPIEGGEFMLSTRIDRIDILQGDALAIIDYKTGAVPNKTDVENGAATQLGLEAFILSQAMPAHSLQSLEYWKLSANENGLVKLAFANTHDIMNAAKASLDMLIDKFVAESGAFEASEWTKNSQYARDYDHLIRKAEWDAV